MNKENENFIKGEGLIPENCIVFFKTTPSRYLLLLPSHEYHSSSSHGIFTNSSISPNSCKKLKMAKDLADKLYLEVMLPVCLVIVTSVLAVLTIQEINESVKE